MSPPAVAGDDGVGQGGRAGAVVDTSPPPPALPLMVQSVRVAVPELNTPPPHAAGVVAADGAVGQGGRAGIEHAAAVAVIIVSRCCSLVPCRSVSVKAVLPLMVQSVRVSWPCRH